MRPVYGVSESNNSSLSDLFSEVISQLVDKMNEEIKTLYLSTEEMCVGLEKMNTMGETKKLPVVLSMDVVKMSPSLRAEEVGMLVR